MTQSDGTGRWGSNQPDPTSAPIGGIPGMVGPAPGAAYGSTSPGNYGGASGGYPVTAQPPLAGYPSPGSASGASASSAFDPASGYGPGGDEGEPPPYTAAPYAAGPYAAGPYAAGPYAAGPYAAGPYPSAPYAAGPYQAPYAFAGYPPYPVPYATYPTAVSQRPGTTLSAGVMAFVTGGMDLVGGILTLFVSVVAPVVSDVWWVPWLWVVTAVSLCCGGLLIAGGVLMLRGQAALLFAGGAATAVVAVYWLAVIGAPSGEYQPFVALRIYPVIYLALTAVMVGLALAPSARSWQPERPGT